MDDKENVKDDHSRMKDMSPEELDQWLGRLRMANRCCNDNSSVTQECKNAQQTRETQESPKNNQDKVG